jgi:pimeloyl-ACP methyl ester carboxylesterase
VKPAGPAYRDEGDPQNPVVVLLRGDGGDADPWAEVVGALSPWMRVIAPEPDDEASPRDLAARIRALLGSLGVTRHAVAGEGAGGQVAQALALAGGVDAMVLIGSPPLEDADDALAELQIPALVVYGEDDQRLPATALAERFAEILPMASVALLPGLGHALLEDAPEIVVPLLFQWLRSRYLKVPHVHESGPVLVQLGRRPREDLP